MYFDGSDVGLATNSNEDVGAVHVRESGGTSTLLLTTIGNFSVTGVSGANEDVVAFNPTSLGGTTAGTYGPGLAFDGSLYGLSSFTVDGIDLSSPPGAAPLLAQSRAVDSDQAIRSGLVANTSSAGSGQTTLAAESSLQTPRIASSATPVSQAPLPDTQPTRRHHVVRSGRTARTAEPVAETAQVETENTSAINAQTPTRSIIANLVSRLRRRGR
jgi:hypothetical protein